MSEKKNVRIEFLRASQMDAAVTVLCRANQSRNRTIFPHMFLGIGEQVSTAFVALIDDKVVGTVCVSALREDLRDKRPFDSALISSLAVDPAYQGQGIGRELMRRAERHIADNFFRNTFCVSTLADATKRKNPQSRFYEDQGYKDAGYANENGTPVLFKLLNKHATPVPAAPFTPA